MSQPTARKPGELVFAALMLLASLGLLWNAYGISGFEKLSAPGAIPMATTAAMVVTAAMVLWGVWKRPADPAGSFGRDVLPLRIAVVALMLVGYAFALKPLGFLPTSAIFLILVIKYLSQRSWVFSIGIGLVSLIGIYLVFRIVFSVLMPAGIVPEGEILAFVRGLLHGGN